MCFIKRHLFVYLFVFSVATLNDSGSHLLLFPERTTLRGGEKRQAVRARPGPGRTREAPTAARGAPAPRPCRRPGPSGPGTSWRCLYCQFTQGTTLKMNLYTTQATNQNLGVYFEDVLYECCSGTNCIFVLAVGVTHVLFSNTLYSLTPNKEDMGHSGHIPCIS